MNIQQIQKEHPTDKEGTSKQINEDVGNIVSIKSSEKRKSEGRPNETLIRDSFGYDKYWVQSLRYHDTPGGISKLQAVEVEANGDVS